METTEKEFQEIAEHLGDIQKMYQKLLDMEAFNQEKILLEYIISVCATKEGLLPVKEVCERIINMYPSGVNYFETTLIDEAIALLDAQHKRALPATWFDKDILLYKLGYAVIEESFKEFDKYSLERNHQLILDNLKRHVRNSFVNNPNFKGENPYYKRFYQDFDHSKKLTREFLDNDFSNYIDYFNGN